MRDVVVVGGEAAFPGQGIDVAGARVADDLPVAVVFLEDPDHVPVVRRRPTAGSAWATPCRPRRGARASEQDDRRDYKKPPTEVTLHRARSGSWCGGRGWPGLGVVDGGGRVLVWWTGM